MTARIEIDEMGRTILILPEDIVEEFQLEEGDIVSLKQIKDCVLIDF